jgi:CRP-like cAMP-binding protein
MAFRLLCLGYKTEGRMIPNAQRQSTEPRSLSAALSVEDPRVQRYRSLLSQTAMFQGAGQEALSDLARRLQVRTRPAGAMIVAQDEPGDAMYVLVSGRAKVALFGESGRELTLTVLQAGDFFGEMSLIDGRPRSANVQALDDTTMLMLSREAFLSHLQTHPQTAVNLLSELTRRLRAADETIASLALFDVEARLVRALERLARADGGETEGGLILRRRPTQQELANMVGSCRETISRTLTQLVRRGLVVPRGRTLFLSAALLERREAAQPVTTGA